MSLNRAPKQPGYLKLVYYSRVSPKKNLLGAIEALRGLQGRVTLDVCGPIEDAAYRQRCRQQIATLPNNINVDWRGPVNFDSVPDTLAQYDAMLLPTFGENFGHAIVEALAAGCPVVISDRTPWRGLASRGVGWDLPLDNLVAYHRALAALAAMDEWDHGQMRTRSIQYAASAVSSPDAVESHRRLFQQALGTNYDSAPARRRATA
jgi:glycosyltransferase involved in cell wall biosynthesis